MRIFIFEEGLKKAPTEYSRYLVYPYSAEYSHDDVLGAGSVTLRNMDRAETFAPGTVVMIGDGHWQDNILDQWVIVSAVRGANHGNKKYSHTLYLCDLTKLLERDAIGNKTFTRSIVLDDLSAEKSFSAVASDTNKDFAGKNYAHTKYYFTAPSLLSPWKTTVVTWPPFSSVFPNKDAFESEGFLSVSRTIKVNGEILVRRLYSGLSQKSIITAGGVSTTTDMPFSTWYETDNNISTINITDSGVVEFEWEVNNYLEGSSAYNENRRTVYGAIYKVNATTPIKTNPSLRDACQILANLADGSRVLQGCTVRAIGENAQRAMRQEITDIDISEATLREAIDMVAGIGGCFCRYRVEYDVDLEGFEHYIDLHPISDRTRADLSKLLGGEVVRKMSDSIEGACSELDSTVHNLVTLSDSGTVCEPTDNSWISLRSEDVRITEDTAEIPTSFPIYRIDKLEVIYGEYTADITKYVVEKTSYDLLSSYAPAYPRSKAYALYYQRGQVNIKGLSFEQEDAISQLRVSPSIVNICNAEFDTEFNNLGLKDGTLYYPGLGFRITYIPIVEARVRQTKPDSSDNATPNILFYNQSANYVDSVRYGRNMAGAAERGGQPGKAVIYKARWDVKLPEPGQLFDDDYTISKVTVQKGRDTQTIQLDLARYYNRLNPFIGIDSAPRLFEISEQGYVPRNIIYEDYCIIGDVQSGGVKSIVTADGLSGFQLAMVSAPTTGSYTPTIAIAQGKSAITGSLTKCALPIASFGLGKSLVFAFSYKDNYSAGDKAVPTEEYTELYRVKKAVPYADDFGEIERLSVIMADSSNTDSIYPDSLPEDTSANTYRAIFQLNDRYIWKDSREQIKFTYQVHFVTNKGWIISPAMAEDFKMITRKSSALSRAPRLYRLSYELSRTDTTIDLSRATREAYHTTSTSTVISLPLSVDAAAQTVKMRSDIFGALAAYQKFTGTGKAWAVAYDDGKLLFGDNQTITTATSLPNINFSFRHTTKS